MKQVFAWMCVPFLFAAGCSALVPGGGFRSMPPQVASSHLVLYLPMDESESSAVSDSSGRDHAVRVVGATARAPGRHGRALAFDGNDYIRVEHASDLVPAAFTFAAWVRPAHDLTGGEDLDFRIVASKELGPAGYFLGYFGTGDGEYGMTWKLVGPSPAGTYTHATSRERFRAGVWYHLAGVFDGTNQYLYVDGRLVERTRRGMPPARGGAPLCIGQGVEYVPHDHGWIGLIDDVRLYDCALTAADVRKLAGGKGVEKNEPPPAGFAAHSPVRPPL